MPGSRRQFVYYSYMLFTYPLSGFLSVSAIDTPQTIHTSSELYYSASKQIVHRALCMVMAGKREEGRGRDGSREGLVVGFCITSLTVSVHWTQVLDWRPEVKIACHSSQHW